MQTSPEAIRIRRFTLSAIMLAFASLSGAAGVLLIAHAAALPFHITALLLCVPVTFPGVLLFEHRRHARIRYNHQKLAEEFTEVAEQNHSLRGQVEVLAAMREVIRIINEQVNFYRIADQVFAILERLLKTEEICLIVKENGNLTPKALRREGKMFFDDIIPAEEENAMINSAITTGEMQKVVKNRTAIIVCPLLVDLEVSGAIKFVLPVGGMSDETSRKIDHAELAIHDIAPHIALAIKTPSLHERAILDGLTGLYSRSHFENQLKDHASLARRYGKTFALIMMDIDHFKLVNDLHGHLAGDVVLNRAAALIKQNVRNCDSVYRYGGEEIAVILPETTAVQSQVTAERLRLSIASNVFMAGQSRIRVTVSQGIAEFQNSDEVSAELDLISRSDQALYAAKAFGRNKTCIWSSDGPKLVGR